jgi:Coenzyme PQQ synthesis protein D (PqqD)
LGLSSAHTLKVRFSLSLAHGFIIRNGLEKHSAFTARQRGIRFKGHSSDFGSFLASSGGDCSCSPIYTCYSVTRFLDFTRESPVMLTLNSIIQRDTEVMSSEADQDLIMVSIATGCYYGLSDVAREVWDAIESPKRVSDLVGGLTKSYNVNSSLCEEQTLSFLQTLLDEGLLQVKDGSAG